MYKPFLLLLCVCSYNPAYGKSNNELRTLVGNLDYPDKTRTPFIVDSSEFEGLPGTQHRKKREVQSENVDGVKKVINTLNDSHKHLMVYWVGEKSRVVICLARDPGPIIPGISVNSPSTVFISYDDGDHYENKTENFKMPNGKYATLDKFYNHPKFHTHFVFTDTNYNLMYLTTDHGKTFETRQLNFTPNEVSFHETKPSIFLVLDKNDTNNQLWVTEDFGKTFRVAHEFVKSFYWMKDTSENYQLIVQRMEPNNLSSVIYSRNLFRSRAQIYSTSVKDLFFKGDYVFTTKFNAKGELVLYASYKLGKQLLCLFDSAQKFLSYFIVDVTDSRALIAVSHSNTSSSLYVSEGLGGTDGELRFMLSLENIFAFFPSVTWQNTWLTHVSEEAFVDIYKVEGITGIYIASKLIYQPENNSLKPQHLGSLITFDYGSTWRLIPAPATDILGQSTGCVLSRNCSLHLSQKFNQIFPDTRTISILSSKSAPGIIMATGVLGKSLKGHYGVYISLDAGLTWHQTLHDLNLFNMGDHGGILAAVEYFKSKEATRNIKYSIDEGEQWKEISFHDEGLRLYGLMTEPGENTTVFTMFGSLPAKHEWIIVKIDLKGVFNRTCSKPDYKMWSPSQNTESRSYIPCILGQQVTYERRMSHAYCLNGLDYVRVVSKQSCDCDVLDYECDFGFISTGSPSRCIRDKALENYDPYKIPSDCSPGKFYNRTKGYQKISGDVCIGGFESHYLPDSVPCPIKEVDDFLLFAQRENISRYNFVTKRLEELPIKDLKNVIAIDFDMSSNCVYWADIAEDTIGRQCFNNGSSMEILVSTDLSSIEGMALDWISKTLYLVDGFRVKIELIRTNINHSGHMRRTILNSSVLRKPRGIALHPQAGYMFWTDWSAENPSINRANLDGSKSKTLFGRDKVEWPNGITIDYIANRIYWVDAKKDYIGSSDLHGDGFVKVVAENKFVFHPFAIAVFKNDMYWDDWERNSIFSADKDNFKGVEVVLQQMPGLMDLKVFAHGIQIGTNKCSNSSCPYICVGLPKNNFACLCPDGLTMKDGKCMCPGNITPYANLTCQASENTCSSEHFTCSNNVCIPKGWKCDGEDDCGDGSDEKHCFSQTCPTSFFMCGDGKCLPNYWRCDYDKDCPDGSDEIGCPKHNCTVNQFSCENGRCIQMNWKCDGENDCRDGSDERNCNPESPVQCKSDEFHCKSGSIPCIPLTWKCDTDSDCGDNSDELDCANNTCSEDQISCGPPNNQCIYKNWICDGESDCSDGRDEVNCTTPTPESPKKTTHFGGVNGTCQSWMFVCKNFRCIPFWWKCDGVDDCGDNSDELGCSDFLYPIGDRVTTYRPPTLCDKNQFQCATGECILSAWVCDGRFDCHDGEDENNCSTSSNCSTNQFKCRSDGSCISASSVCDGRPDCPDETDESFCEKNLPEAPATPSCNRGLFPCDGTCYPLALLCDGKVDCKDMYDEFNCTDKSRIYQVMRMAVEERNTNDTSIYLYWQIQSHVDVELEFQPSIVKAGDGKWKNDSWTQSREHQFTSLEPFTKYNMTVYVRVKNSSMVFPPAVFLVSWTREGVPSEPWNVTAKQRNGSHILVSWNEPLKPSGVIEYYEIYWSSETSLETTLKLTGNETSHLLSTDFEHGTTYTFSVVAYNKKYSSNKSEPVTLVFDGHTNVTVIKNLTVTEVEDVISLSWTYDGEADGYNVVTAAERPYPNFPSRVTKTNNITLRLAPGANYRIEVNAFKKDFIGPSAVISLRKSGKVLPEVNITQSIVLKEIGTTVKLSWDRPKYSKKVNWVYGVYYGLTLDQLFEKPQYTTSNLTASITNLDSCEVYIVAVGLIGPLGYGPLSRNLKQITTAGHIKAPPKKIVVSPDGGDRLRMKVQWEPSCPSTTPDFYIIEIYEKSTTQTWHRRVSGNSLSYRVFNVSYGGIYNVRVATDYPGATYSKPVTYEAPPILPPFETSVSLENNGSYKVSWLERKLPNNIGKYFYEVLVQEGNSLNETYAQKFVVDKPPFFYTNSSHQTYTFAVRIRTGKGLHSQASELVSKESTYIVQPINMTAVIVPSILVLIVLIMVIVFLVIRNRRLQSNFTRFSNSHYDSRSDAATFDDRTLEDDESPQIRGFSDDEPLVIA
ncbi:sortilin-related receptor [Leptinotarsa decemlineata]|uniref:sortilin-related receptor n=1 Tax=Leptinotarsa decemlineata TaxID=7539 RepID=UPI003D305BC4